MQNELNALSNEQSVQAICRYVNDLQNIKNSGVGQKINSDAGRFVRHQ